MAGGGKRQDRLADQARRLRAAGDRGGTRAGLPKINPFSLSWANAAYAVLIRGRPTMTSTG